jgi:hypothetical protein
LSLAWRFDDFHGHFLTKRAAARTCKPGDRGGSKKSLKSWNTTYKGESRHGLGPTSYLHPLFSLAWSLDDFHCHSRIKRAAPKSCKPAGDSDGINKSVHNRKYRDKGESRHGMGSTSYL